MLSTAIRNYALNEKEDGEVSESFRLMSLAKKMVPVVENIETVNMPRKTDSAVLLMKTKIPVTTEEDGQLRFC